MDSQRSGYAAHECVPASHWCVMKADLYVLRSKVREYVAQGFIMPSEFDPFDPDDDAYGPCIHTVVQLMIRPICAMKGGRSWALLHYPEGLKCDLFISHSWSEGVYEFLDKVLHSWPLFAKHAYCCMLANPQTLDIGDMIASPSTSPFAQALASATYVMVVPNHVCSVYTRSWCTYEAFLACRWEKSLRVAKAPQRGRIRIVLICLVLSLLSAVVQNFVVNSLKASSNCDMKVDAFSTRAAHPLEMKFDHFELAVAQILTLASLVLNNSCRWVLRAVNYMGVIIHTGVAVSETRSGHLFVYEWLGVISYVCSELDALNDKCLAIQQRQLEAG